MKLLVWLFLSLFSVSSIACPKLIFQGVLYKSTQDAQYWGQTVGIQGTFVLYAMASWQSDVGATPNTLWYAMRNFQQTYAKYGVTDNFIKVSLYNQINWADPAGNNKVVANFGHVAKMARYAGIKGIVLDLEPYKPTWAVDSTVLNQASTVQSMGKRIAQAMYAAYPGMTLIVIPDVMYNYKHVSNGVAIYNPKYALVPQFISGLLSVNWANAVVGLEQTYRASGASIINDMQLFADGYKTGVSLSPGLWPLGKSYTDKSALETPASFQQRLITSYASASQYVWIYGSGSAWQTDGPFGAGPVVSNFNQYTTAIHTLKNACK